MKIKSLAAEAKIIRQEEQRARTAHERASLAEHRRGIVRYEARHALLAYAFLRGTPHLVAEPTCRDLPNYGKVLRNAKAFSYGSRKDQIDAQLEAWWLSAPKQKDCA